ncbi:MAG: hypothetical protein K8S22_17080, partial [Betaproteobacteria bacterium]|nr:hypothetical protein [Betaproteobacteria bacterium]
EQEVSPAGLQALRALKASLDPKQILNPGKLLPEPGATGTSGQTGNSTHLFQVA